MNRRGFLHTAAASALALRASRLLSAMNSKGFKLGLITDEADADLGRVLRDFMPKYHLHWAEIRDVKPDGKEVYLSTSGTLAQARRVRDQLDDAHVQCSVCDTGIFKSLLPGTEGHYSAEDLHHADSHTPEKERELIKRSAPIAHALGTKKLRIFAFLRVPQPDTVFSRVVGEIEKALRIAESEDLELVLENESSTNIGTGVETARFMKELPHPRLCHNWDPGNAFDLGETPFPNGWDALDKSRICHIHLKDAVKLPNGHFKWMPVGGGKIDFIGQFRALKAMHYSGTMSLETHYRNAANDRWTSTIESMDGLMKVIQEA